MTIKVLKNARLRNRKELVNVVIAGDRIQSLGPALPEKADEEYDLQGRLVLPGLINVHTHLDKSGLAERITNTSGTITEARQRLFAAKSGLTKEDIKERAKKTILNAVQTGTTAIRSHVDVDPTVGLKGIEALLELKKELAALVDLQIVAFPQEGISEAPGTLALLKEALRSGADIVGGHLSIARDFPEHAGKVFDLAEEFSKDIDVHVDYDIDRDYTITSRHTDGREYPDQLGVVALVKEKEKRGFTGEVVASHLCGLDSISGELARNVIEFIARTGTAVVALPPNNLYCHGRSDAAGVRRGVTKVKPLLEAGVNVAFGPDNIRDPFNPLGNANMIQNAVLTAYACHMASTEDYEKLLDMCTTAAARIMKLPGYGLEPGCYADLVVLAATGVEQALANQAHVSFVFKKGRLVAANEIQSSLFLD